MTPPGAGRVLVVGAINVDFVVAASRLPGPGETVVGPRLERHGGGKGANAAVAAARVGADVGLIGAVGADDTGAVALDELRAQSVGVGDVAILEDEATGVALIVVDPDGENQIAVGLGANGAVAVEHVRRALAVELPGADCVLVSTEIPGAAVVAAVEAATAAGVRCILNSAPVLAEVAGLLAHGPLLTPNATELADLARLLDCAGETVAASAQAIAARTGAPVVVTMGGDGALVMAADGTADQVPVPVTTVRDTTGAGDTFNGVLAARLAAGDTLAAAVRTAIVAASLSVAHVGARAGMPDAMGLEAALSAA
jgi:ribokinase